MPERESQLERDVSVDVGTDLDRESDARGETREDGGWLRNRLASLASPRSFLVALVLTIAGLFIFGAVPFLGVVGDLLGIAAAGFIYGLGAGNSRYVEMALAGALAGGGSAVLGNLIVALVASGTTLVVAGAVVGALAGVVGHYFGRDLRHGLTRELD